MNTMSLLASSGVLTGMTGRPSCIPATNGVLDWCSPPTDAGASGLRGIVLLEKRRYGWCQPEPPGFRPLSDSGLTAVRANLGAQPRTDESAEGANLYSRRTLTNERERTFHDL